jgi:hypothetical protein
LACRVHGLAPLLHLKLQHAPWLDSAIKEWLARQYHCNVFRLTKMHSELKDILALFSRQQLPLIPLKGSILSTAYYSDPATRPMADLDLLIQPSHFASAARLLGQLGYQQEVVHWKHTEFVKSDNRQVVSPETEHPDNPRKVEVHLHCRETFGGPTIELTDLMWLNLTEGSLWGEPALLPKPEVLWLHLLVHTTYHMWQGKGRAIYLVDLAQVTPQVREPLLWLNQIDARFTYPSLALLAKYFPQSPVTTLLAAQHERLSESFRRWVNSLDLVNISYLNPTPGGLYLTKALKFSEGRPIEVAQALRFALWPRLEELALDHPRLAQSKAPWLAYFLLPFDWAKRLKGKGRRMGG